MSHSEAIPDFNQLPDAFRESLATAWDNYCQEGGRLPAALVGSLPRVWATSDYVIERMQRDEGLADWLAAHDRLNRPLDPGILKQSIDEAIAAAETEADLQRVLRQLRHRHMCRIIWRDISRRQQPDVAYHDTVSDLSLLADNLVSAALNWLYQRACESSGTPRNAAGEPVRLVVLAMGKLGAGELNLSSDIDLIFAYPEDGEVTAGERTLTFHQWFAKLGRDLIRVLDELTPDGFVFRVDMRLRPWGNSGALACSFDTMESYYEREGRGWERYALIKMRPIAGDIEAGQQLLQQLSPFVYRRYVDYGAFQHLREMKLLIEREVRRRGLQDDIKLGSGGIREIEFVVQAFQLIRGGQLRDLRGPNLLKTLAQLAKHGLLPENVTQELRDAYLFLRNTEHCLQAVADRQTQRLPGDELGLQRLAFAMQQPSCNIFMERLQHHRHIVRRHFDNVITDNQGNVVGADSSNHELTAVWQGKVSADEACDTLENIGLSDVQGVLEQLEAFRQGRAVKAMQPVARERLDRLVPQLLEVMAYQGQGADNLTRLLAFLDAVLRRSTYIALLVENPAALTQLVKLTAASPFIAERLTQFPVLLDELVDVRSLYSPPPREKLADELHQHLLRLPDKDLEQQMDALRTFKQAHLLRVAACEISGTLPLMQVSDYLTWLAEAILEQVVRLAWEALTEKHGIPLSEDGNGAAADFLVLGYGKLGGIELSHRSDLDLVFLYDAPASGQTDGNKPLSNEQFFARLSRRVIHILTTRTLSGPLYEVDVRLRPGGASGLLVSSLAAFERYQREQAWVWEQQALVRVRPVAGSEKLAKAFTRLRRHLLCQTRDTHALREEVLAMRERMYQNASSDIADGFHIKQGRGGIVDIEFMVQYGVLRWAHQYPELAAYTDNVRLLEALAAQNRMSAADAGLLREAYLTFRSAIHTQSLKNAPAVLAADAFADLRAGVGEVWERWFAPTTDN